MSKDRSDLLGKRSEAIYRALLAQLDSGRYRAGMRLPTEKELTAEHGVSRKTVRRAIARLEAEGRVESVHGSGLFMRDPADDRPRVASVMMPYDGACLDRLQRIAIDQGCLLNVFSQTESTWDPELERRFLRRVRESRAAVLLAFCSPVPPRNDDTLAEVAAAGVRVVHIQPYGPGLPVQEFLMPDYERAGMAAATSLLLAGHRRLVITGWAAREAPVNQRIADGVRQALALAGGGEPAYFEDWVVSAELPPEVLRSAADLPAGAGIVAVSVGHGQAVAAAAAAAGRDIPADLGLVAIELPDAAGAGCGIDLMAFDQPALFARALTEALRPGSSPLRELVPPRLVPAGTVRRR